MVTECNRFGQFLQTRFSKLYSFKSVQSKLVSFSNNYWRRLYVQIQTILDNRVKQKITYFLTNLILVETWTNTTHLIARERTACWIISIFYCHALPYLCAWHNGSIITSYLHSCWCRTVFWRGWRGSGNTENRDMYFLFSALAGVQTPSHVHYKGFGPVLYRGAGRGARGWTCAK